MVTAVSAPTGAAAGIEIGGLSSSGLVVDPRRLDLVRRLSDAASSWGIWKSVASALSGSGDIDSVVLPADELRVEEAFVEWAVENQLRPVFRCGHASGLMRVLVAVDRERGSIVELDLTIRKTYRGSTLFRADEIVALLERDPAGFRRIRPGAEGVLILFHNGVLPGGRANPTALSARKVVQLLAGDPEGVRFGVTLFEPPAGAARRAVAALLAGSWDRPAVASVELAFLARAALDPVGLARRVWFRTITKRRCPIIRVAYTSGRRLPVDADSWATRTAATHERLDDQT